MADLKKVFGVNETSENLQSKGGVGFGLQENAKLTKFILDAEAQYGPQIVGEVTLSNGSVLKWWLNLQVHPDAKDEEAELINKFAAIKHVVKSVGVTDEQIAKATSDATDFVDGVKKTLTLLPTDFDKKLVDIFTEWQLNIGNNQDQTFVTLPGNMKGGRFICPHVDAVGSWKEEIAPKEYIKYTDDAGNIHPLEKGTTFMMSARSYQQFKKDAKSVLDTAVNGEGKESAEKSVW